MSPGSFQTLYDVSRDSGGLNLPVLVTMAWLLPSIGALLLMKRSWLRRNLSGFLCLWLIISAGLAGVGYAGAWHEHARLLHELQSRQFQIVEGLVTANSPKLPRRSERFTVGGINFTNSSMHLPPGPPRWPGSTSRPLQVGTYLRVTYDRDLAVLRLETPSP